MNIDPNSPAFSRASSPPYCNEQSGMSIRTWLAGQALAGFTVRGEYSTTAAFNAVAFADATIAELNRVSPSPS